MEPIYNSLRKLRYIVENNSYIIVIILFLTVFSWIGNFIISNDIELFNDRPNVKSL